MKPGCVSRRELRCEGCRALLGVFASGVLEIRRKDLRVAVEGRASVDCYRCGKVNVATPDTNAESEVRS